MRPWLRSKLLGLQWWLTVFGVVFTVWMIVAVFVLHASDGPQGAALLPPPTCAHGSRQAQAQTYTYTAEEFTVRYTDCDQLSNTDAASAVETLRAALSKLAALGLPEPAEPIAVALTTNQKGPAAVAFPAANGGRGAIELNSLSTDLGSLEGLAELSIAQSAPGLTAGSRERVADAFAMIAGGQPIIAPAVSALYYGLYPKQETGLFDAWLASRYGLALLKDAIGRCGRSCGWPKALAAALAPRHGSLSGLEGQFVARAVPAARRTTLLADLNTP